MSLRVQIIVVLVLLIGLFIILNMVKKRALELKYVLGWIACDIVLLLFAIFPELMDQLAQFMGIYSPVNMIFFLGFIFSIVIIFSLTIALSRVTLRVRKLAQKMALETEKRSKHIDIVAKEDAAKGR